MNYTDTGCSYSKLNAYPSNWATGGKSLLSQTWRIDYTFYDPNFKDRYPKGKQVRIKAGLNRIEDLSERRVMMQELLKNELDMLKFQGYNPISQTIRINKPAETSAVIHSNMCITEALSAAKNVKRCTQEWKLGLESVIRWVDLAAKALGLDTLPISQFSRKHIKMILDQLGVLKKGKWTNTNYNNHRKALSSLWDELEEYEAVEYNPIEKIKVRPVSKVKKQVLTDEERGIIDETIRKNDYRFWLAINLFFHGGSRRREFLEVRGKDVDLTRQVYKALVKKGPVERIVERPIKDIAVNFWQQALVNCEADQYVFSVDLKPGNHPIRPEQLTRRWRRHVKIKLGINADFYSLKYLNTDEVTIQLGIEAAARLNAHSPVIAAKHYAINEDQRQMERIRKVDNTFLPKKI